MHEPMRAVSPAGPARGAADRAAQRRADGGAARPRERADAAPRCAQVGPFWGQGSGQETAKVQMYISAPGARGGAAHACMPGPVLTCRILV
jgi:hypothetical protein